MKNFNNRTDIPGLTFDRELNVLSNIANLVPDNGSILEIGPCWGRTTHALYLGKKESVSLTTVDYWGQRNHSLKGWFGDPKMIRKCVHLSMQDSKLGFDYCMESVADKITVIQEDSKTFIKNNQHQLNTYNLVFLDGSHDYESISYELNAFYNNNTLIVGDDANMNSFDVVRAIFSCKRDMNLIVPSSLTGDIKLFALIPIEGFWRNLQNEILQILTYN